MIVVIFGPLVPVCMLLIGPLVWLQLCALDNIDRHNYGAAQNIATILVVADTHVIRNFAQIGCWATTLFVQFDGQFSVVPIVAYFTVALLQVPSRRLLRWYRNNGPPTERPVSIALPKCHTHNEENKKKHTKALSEINFSARASDDIQQVDFRRELFYN